MRIHHSFLRAPTGYTPRPADPRIGVSSVAFRDYAKPFNENTDVEWVTRWRLEKQNPGAAMSEPKKPIVFYLDAAIPEPIRSAMRPGRSPWNKAFEAAGFRNAVQVKDPTPDMDPMDIRYAWILWINRDERGFSSGGTFRDPRTGEILGSKTRMDSHRIRTIGNYFESYTPTTGGRGDDAGFDELRDGAARARRSAGAGVAGRGVRCREAQRELVLRRQSLLTAHELGHVMGFGHNLASSINDRASVMEYPTPRVKVTGARLDLSEAFERDHRPLRRLHDPLRVYRARRRQGARRASTAIIAEMRAKNILYVPVDRSALGVVRRPRHADRYLRETMAARKIMLAQYGPAILQAGEPIGALRDHAAVDDLPAPPLGHRGGTRLRRRHVPQHRRQGRNAAADRNRSGRTAARRARPADGEHRAGQPGDSGDAARAAHAELRCNNLEDLAEDYAFDHLRAGAHPVRHGARAAAHAGARGAPGGLCRSPGRRASRCPKSSTRCSRARGGRRRTTTRATDRCAASPSASRWTR